MEKIFFELDNIIKKENNRQENGFNLIASENICPPEIQTYLLSSFHNKYAEGIPGNRYYSGCQYCDELELFTQKKATTLFSAEYANVQPHAGTEANLISYNALLEKGDGILSMDMSAGGHLSHGHQKHIMSKLYTIFNYSVDKITERIDYNYIDYLAKKHSPKMIISGASAYTRLIDYENINYISKKYNCIHLCDMAHIAGLVAGKMIPSPVPYSDIVTFTTHKTFGGPRGGIILAKEIYKKKIERSVLPGIQGGPFMHAIAAKCAALLYANTPQYQEYQANIIKNAKLFESIFKSLGLKLVAEGTDNHMIIINTMHNGKTGKEVSALLEEKNIFVSKSMIPFDETPASITSGIRIGVAMITRQNKKESELINLAESIAHTILK